MTAVKEQVAKLPCIPQPTTAVRQTNRLRSNTDVNALKLHGTQLQGSAIAKQSCPAQKAFKHKRSSSMPPAQPRGSRPNSSTCSQPTAPMMPAMNQQSSHTMTPQQLIDVLTNKLRGNGYFILRNAFSAFDHEQRGHITREALYRILCNTLNGITRQQFSIMLRELTFPATKQTFSFHEIYSKFRIMSPTYGKTMADRLSCHVPRSIKASYVHSMLVARAEKCIHHLSDFLPRWRGLEGQLDRVEFRNILSYLSLPMGNEEFEKLWKRYDPSGKGYITGSELMQHMGVTMATGGSRPSTVSSILSSDVDSVVSYDECCHYEGLESDEAIFELIKDISHKLKKRGEMLLEDLKERDDTKCGKVTKEQLLLSFRKLDFLMSPEQFYHLLIHFGYDPDSGIDYNSLVSKLSSLSGSSISNSILTAKDQRFVIPMQGRPCLTTPDAEGRLICTLQHDFLNLLSKMKSHDRGGKGYIERAEFVKILEFLAPPTSKPAIQSLADNLQDNETGLIQYPMFLAMFDGPPVPKNNSNSIPGTAADVRGDTKGADASLNEHRLKVYETKQKFLDICRKEPQRIIDVFEEIDTGNTGRLTKATFQQILFRVGLEFNKEVINSLWSDVLKNKDGTIDQWELIRQFGLRQSNDLIGGAVRPIITSHHCTATDDSVTIIKNIKMMIQANFKTLSVLFAQHDPKLSGLIPTYLFTKVLKSFVPSAAKRSVISCLVRLYGESDGESINYHAFLKDNQPGSGSSSGDSYIYRIGNNMKQLLACPQYQPMTLPLLQQKIATPPQYGLPGIKSNVQRKIQQRWLDLKRQLAIVDPADTGRVSMKYFRYILNHHGISLSKEDMRHILDPAITIDSSSGTSIDYKAFFNILMGQSDIN